MNDSHRRLAVAFFFFSMLPTLAACESVEGNGVLVTETRVTGPFTRVEVASALVATVQNGDTDVVLTMDENLLPYVRTAIDGDTLIVDVEDAYSIDPSAGAHIVISSPRIEAVAVSGSSVASVTTVCDEVKLEASGASVLHGRIEADAVSLEASGASVATLTGTATELDVEASGSSDVDSSAETAEAHLDASGASRIAVKATSRVRIRASGASDIHVAGDPSARDVETSGSSSVDWE